MKGGEHTRFCEFVIRVHSQRRTFLVAGTHFSFINLARTGHRVARWVAGYPTRVSPLRSVRRVFNCNQNYQQRTLGTLGTLGTIISAKA
jgi:hypothetical protein